MLNIYKLHSISWIVLLLLFCGINCDDEDGEEEWVLLAKSHVPRPTSTVISMYDDSASGKLTDPYLYEPADFITEGSIKSDTEGSGRRTNMQYENETSDGLNCLWCSTDRGFMSDESCFTGKTESQVRCSETEICYTELHPQYIKRGCFDPKKMNKTFVCNCPLCNDKPAYNPVYYHYKKISDWEYHNTRVQMPIVGMRLICKVCDTRGLNKLVDENCRNGKNTEYTMCKRNQVCYINIDEVKNTVSRGCIDTPAYNSLFYFCNHTICNSKSFQIPKMNAEKLQLNPNALEPGKNSEVSLNFFIFKKFLIILKGVLLLKVF